MPLDYPLNCSYKEAMNKLSLEDLQTKRTKLTLRFARLHKSEGKITSLFNNNKKNHMMTTRKSQKSITMANTNRYKKLPILHMQKLLNSLDNI